MRFSGILCEIEVGCMMFWAYRIEYVQVMGAQITFE